MTKVTNLTREPLDFVVGVKDGAAVTDSLDVGETKDMAIDLASAQVIGRLHAGLISMPASAEKKIAKAVDPA